MQRSQNVSEGRNCNGKVPKADVKPLCAGAKRAVCAGVRGALEEAEEAVRGR